MASLRSGYYARAEFEFVSNQTGDLSFEIGDVIFVERTIDRDWLFGENVINDRVSGIFPANFVTKLSLPARSSLNADQRVLVSHSDFVAQQKGDLGFEKGTLILGLNRLDTDWWEGALLDPRGHVTGRKGIFPVNFVTELPDDGGTSGSNGSGKRQRAKVVNNLKAQLPEEISLIQGETVWIDEFVDKMWCRGESMDGTRKGIFPRGFVEVVSEESETEPIEYASLPPVHAPPALPSPLLKVRGGGGEEIEPYGRTKYPFKAEYSGELGFGAGVIVKLLRHVDDEWTEGELNAKTGIFPSSYIDVVVDCVSPVPDSGYGSASENTYATIAETRDERTVQHDFYGSEPGDLTARAGDRISVLRNVNPEWFEAIHTPTGRKGLIPMAFVAPKSTQQGHNKWSQRTQSFNDGQSSVQWRSGSQGLQNAGSGVRESLDETITKNLASLGSFSSSTGGDRQSVVSRAPNLSLATRSSTVSSSASIASNGSEIFYTPPSTPTSFPCLNPLSVATPPSRDTPPPRPKNSPGIKKVDPLELERQKRQKETERQEKMKEHRQKVASELLKTERDYLRDLESCQRAFGDAMNRALDADMLMQGFPAVAALARKVLDGLEKELARDATVQELGSVFVRLNDDFRTVFDHFLDAHEEATIALDKHETDAVVQTTLKHCLQRVQKHGCVCMDTSSVLCRPMQRSTDERHPDRPKLIQAVKLMTEIAQGINESKRRKDLVSKYRKEGDVSLSDRLSKLTLHSVRKKGSRFGVRLTSTIGLTQLARDETFEAAERDYRSAEKSVRNLLRDLQSYCEQLQHSAAQQESCADNWREIWIKSAVAATPVPDDVRRYAEAWRRVADVALPAFFAVVKFRVREPLDCLNAMFHGPDNLIAKRRDKLLDYEAAGGRTSKLAGDVTKHQLATDAEKIARAEYEALNGQLIAELPKLTALAQDILRTTVKSLLIAQSNFAQETKQALAIFNHHSRSVDTIWPNLNARQNKALDGLATLATLSQALKPTNRRESTVTNPGSFADAGTPARSSQRFKSYMKTSEHGKIDFPQRRQAEADRNSLRAKCTGSLARQLYVATTAYHGVNDKLDLTVAEGDLVLALMQKDPMGNSDRWYVDNGLAKGFVPRTVLAPLAETGSNGAKHARPPLPRQQSAAPSLIDFTEESNTPPPSANYSAELSGLEFTKPVQQIPSTNSATFYVQHPVTAVASMPAMKPLQPIPSRTAAASQYGPQRPKSTVGNAPTVAKSMTFGPQRSASSPAAPAVPQRPQYSNVGYETDKKQQPEQDLVPVRSAPPPPPQHAGNAAAAAKPAGAQLKKQATIDNKRPLTPQTEEEEPVEFYMTEFDFGASDPNELTLNGGQLVAVHMKEDLEGNSEWWLVEDEYGGVGYVPAAYLLPYKPAAA